MWSIYYKMFSFSFFFSLGMGGQGSPLSAPAESAARRRGGQDGEHLEGLGELEPEEGHGDGGGVRREAPGGMKSGRGGEASGRMDRSAETGAACEGERG